MILPELAPLSLKSRTLSMDKLSFGKENASSSLVPGMATCCTTQESHHLKCQQQQYKSMKLLWLHWVCRFMAPDLHSNLKTRMCLQGVELRTANLDFTLYNSPRGDLITTVSISFVWALVCVKSVFVVPNSNPRSPHNPSPQLWGSSRENSLVRC